MTRDDIAKLVRKAGGDFDEQLWLLFADEMDRFVTLVEEAEREACAREAERQMEDEPYGHAKFRCANIAAEIRARSND